MACTFLSWRPGTRSLQALLRMLLDRGQAHVVAGWPKRGNHDDKKRSLMRQLCRLDSTYPGGLAAYLDNAKRLLQESSSGANVYEGYTPAIPEGITLSVTSGTGRLEYFEQLGLEAARDAAFVLVAGGLGERLGYSGIKVRPYLSCCATRCTNLASVSTMPSQCSTSGKMKIVFVGVRLALAPVAATGNKRGAATAAGCSDASIHSDTQQNALVLTSSRVSFHVGAARRLRCQWKQRPTPASSTFTSSPFSRSRRRVMLPERCRWPS